MPKTLNQIIADLLKLRSDNTLYHRESEYLEFKEQFNLSNLAEYFRDFAAFSNNKGGFIIFGVTDSPRKLTGLNKKSIDQFEKIDPGIISGSLIEIFAPAINWKQYPYEFNGNKFGIFYIDECKEKPVIAKKNEGRDSIIKDGDIYFRYGGRTQKILYTELNNILYKRMYNNNKNFLKLIEKISNVGPSNAVILDTEKGLIEKNERQILVIDEELMKKISFLKEGSFVEKNGTIALKLVGDVHPINSIEVIKIKKENLLEQYPLSCQDLINEIQKKKTDAKRNDIYRVIKDNNLKNNSEYSVYNFRNKTQEDNYNKTGNIPNGIPSIYKHASVEFIINHL